MAIISWFYDIGSSNVLKSLVLTIPLDSEKKCMVAFCLKEIVSRDLLVHVTYWQTTLTITCSYTSPAYPSTSGVRSSTEFTANPPQAKGILVKWLTHELMSSV
jgi:hypothetical protein